MKIVKMIISEKSYSDFINLLCEIKIIIITQT